MDKARPTVAEDSFSQNSASVAKETVARMLQRSEELKKRGQIEQTLNILNSLVTYNTNTEKIYLARAEVYRQKNQLSLALADVTRVIEGGSTNGQAYALRAEIYRALKQPKKALADYTQALNLEPQNVKILGKRGATYRILHNFESALRDFNQAIELDPDNAWLYGNRAETYRALNEHRKALNDYNTTIRLTPAATWVYERRSYSNLWLGYINAAQADFQRSWELQPANLAHGWMAEWTEMYKKGFVFSGDTEKRLENIAGTNPEHPAAYLCRAAALLWQGDFGASYNLCEIACLLAPEEPGGYFWKALAAAALNQEKEAFDLLQTALELNLRPIFLPPPAWVREISPLFYDKLTQHLSHHHATQAAGNKSAPGEFEPLTGLTPSEEPELKALPTLTVTGKEEQPAEQPAQTLAEKPGLGQVQGQAAQASEPAVPPQLPTAGYTERTGGTGTTLTPENRAEPPQNTAAAAPTETAAKPAAKPGLTRRAEQSGASARTATKTAPPTAEKENPRARFNFFKVFMALVCVLLVCLFCYFLFVVLPGLIL